MTAVPTPVPTPVSTPVPTAVPSPVPTDPPVSGPHTHTVTHTSGEEHTLRPSRQRRVRLVPVSVVKLAAATKRKRIERWSGFQNKTHLSEARFILSVVSADATGYNEQT